MKIINIMQCTNLGGMEKASLRLMIGLKEQGHVCEVLSLNPLGGLGSLLQEQGITATGFSYSGRGGWRSIPAICRALHSMRADALIMTGHHLLTMLALGGLCRGHRILAIHFYHAGVKPPWQWRLIYRIACNRFQAITFPSDFVRREAETLFPAVGALSKTIRNPIQNHPVPSEEERARARRMLCLPAHVKIIGNAGWLVANKRFDIFLRVAERVLNEVPHSIFLIAGDGEERERLERLADELHIADRIIWLGWQKDMTFFFQSLDVMLFNSDNDAMGIASLEAMSFGVPLVASVEQGGLKEIVTGDEYGFLFPTHDSIALAEKIVFLLKYPDDARRIGEAGRQRVAAVSNPRQLAAEVLSLLKGKGPHV
ncbi:MAG: glycosyltransferase family 4 protein [Desulfocapsaceae bacterium]|nr:glycosyltransferase family 4 protein [Desulfocapsaceae bacterium]